MKHTVTLIPGDGIGPEVAKAAKRVLEASGAGIGWDVQEAGLAVFNSEGDPLPERVIESVRKNKVALKAPVTTPLGKGFRSVNVRLRQTLDLYACVRPCRTMPGIFNSVKGVDIVVVRENTEDLYAGIEYDVGEEGTRQLIELVRKTHKIDLRPDSAISIKPISKTASERIAGFAFDYAQSRGRRKVTAVTKSNIMKYTDGLFMKTSEEVSRKHPKIAYEHRLIDALCMQLVQDPLQFDVLLLPNLYGDIVSDLCAGLIGGLGVAPGANFGEDIAVFEPVHGSAPKYAGQDKVNPMALLRSGVLLLEHLGEDAAARRMEDAIAAVVAEGRDVTYDLGGSSGTSGMAAAIARRIQS